MVAGERAEGGQGLFAKRVPTMMFNGYADEVAGPLCGHGSYGQFLNAGNSAGHQRPSQADSGAWPIYVLGPIPGLITFWLAVTNQLGPDRCRSWSMSWASAACSSSS